MKALSRLFGDEQRRYDELIATLRTMLHGLHEVRMARIERLPEAPGDPQEVVVVAEARSIAWLSRAAYSSGPSKRRSTSSSSPCSSAARTRRSAAQMRSCCGRLSRTLVPGPRSVPGRTVKQSRERCPWRARGTALALRSLPDQAGGASSEPSGRWGAGYRGRRCFRVAPGAGDLCPGAAQGVPRFGQLTSPATPSELAVSGGALAAGAGSAHGHDGDAALTRSANSSNTRFARLALCRETRSCWCSGLGPSSGPSRRRRRIFGRRSRSTFRPRTSPKGLTSSTAHSVSSPSFTPRMASMSGHCLEADDLALSKRAT